MRFDSIQGKLNALFLAFALLVVISVGVTYWGITTQRQDALIINLAGRQRMLVQQMARQALEIERGADVETRLELQGAIETFEQTLVAFQEGGSAPYLSGFSVKLPTTQDPAIQSQLMHLSNAWTPFKDQLGAVLESEPGSQDFQIAIQNIERQATVLVQQADRVVRQFEEAATRKIDRITWIQSGFLVSALVLLVIGSVMTRRSVIFPIEKLRASAERIGRGNLETPVDVQGALEIRSLSGSFEDMRAQLLSSHGEISSWAETLEDRVNQRTLELEALQEVSREISSHLDIQRVLSSVTEKSRQLLGGEAAFLCLLDDPGQTLNLQATSGPDDAVTHLSTSAQACLPGQVLSSDHALLCGIRDCRGSCEMMGTTYRTSHVAASLRAGNRLIGALCVGNSVEDYFTEEDRTMLTGLADAAAIALENARLYERAERTAILEERQILAAEMHDGLAQTIDFIHLTIDYALEQARVNDSRGACETLERGRSALEQASTQARDIITNLGQTPPQPASLQTQLASVIRECNRNGIDIQIDWNTDLKAPVMMSSQDSEQVVRVVREAILNAQKHSEATRITVRLEQANGSRIVTIEDNGKGFDLEKPPDEDSLKHFGVSIMHARAARIGGAVDIRSRPDNGTTVTLRWPAWETNSRLVG